MPTSRQSNSSLSQNGLAFGAGQVTGGNSVDINLSSMPGLAINSALATAIIGTTIRGSTVNAIEVWADGTVWDTTNNRALFGGIDFDPTLLLRSGF